MSKKITLPGKDILGIDEFHNGFHFREYCPTLPMVIAGQLQRNYHHSQNSNGPYEGRWSLSSFNEKGAAKRARIFFERNPDFYYASVSLSEIEKSEESYVRAETIAVLIAAFFEEYSLDSKKTVVVFDRMNGINFLTNLQAYLSKILKMAGISPEIIAKKQAEKITAFRLADRTAKYIGGMRLYQLVRCRKTGSKLSKWPYRSKKVERSSLLERIIRFQEKPFLIEGE